MKAYADALRRSAQPVTAVFLGLSVLAFVAAWAGNAETFYFKLLFDPSVPGEVWRLATWPFATLAMSPLGMLFGGLWLWSMGGIVERELGSARYAAFWFAVTLLSAVMVWIGAGLVGVAAALSGLWVLLAAVTVVWGTRYPTMPVTFMFVLPLQGKWLAWISAVLLLFSMDFRVAPFLAVTLGLCYLFAANKLPRIPYSKPVQVKHTPTKAQKAREQKYFDDVKRREMDRDERERLRKLFERSLMDDPEEPKA